MLKHIVLAGLIFYFNTHLTTAYPGIYLKEIHDSNNRLYENFKKEIIKKAFDLIEKQNELNLVGINNCLQTYIKLDNKLNCIKRFVKQNKYHGLRGSKTPYGPYSDDIFNDYTDITKSENININNMSFSQDYLDIKDLLRSKIGQKKKKFVFQIVNPTERKEENRHDFDNIFQKVKEKRHNSNNFRKFHTNENKTNILRTSSYEASYSDSDEIPQKKKRQRSSESESDLSVAEEVTTRKPKNARLLYIQSPTRFYSPSRRRLPHFLPKRYHWDEDDIKNLKGFWFNGPQGKYWGAYKTTY